MNLEAASVEAPTVINGQKQTHIEGASLVYSFDDAKLPTHHPTRYAKKEAMSTRE